jgi:type III secretion system FlhB-like substrate exporter
VRKEVVMNRDHIYQAFALGFPHGEDAAPSLLARGDFDIAAQMVAVAHRHGIPVVERSELCSMLDGVEVGSSIPETLFEAAAALLVEIGALGRGNRP